MRDSESLPKYEQIKQGLLTMVREQDLKPGDQIISLAEIMARYNVSKVTAVRALVELEKDGVISRIQGRGTFLAIRDVHFSADAGSPTVAIIIPTFTNPFYAEVLAGIEGTISKANFGSEIATTDYDIAREYAILKKIVRERRVKGVVIIPWSGEEHRIDEFTGKLPMVLVDYCPPGMLGHCQLVRGDSFRGAYEGTRHLISLGHRKIGLVRWKYADKERHEGFCAAMRDHGLSEDPPTLLMNANQLLASELLSFVEEAQLTALFLVNDMLAIQALQALRNDGYRVPEDISVIGYDDIDAAQYLDVPLTTVSQHDYDIGRRAGQLMLEQLRGDRAAPPPREVLFTPSLIIRASAAAPPRERRLVAIRG